MEQILSFKKCYVYIDIHVDVCFEIEKQGMNMHQSTKHIARKTRVDRQWEKKTYTHDTDSWRQVNREGMCVRETVDTHSILKCYF